MHSSRLFDPPLLKTRAAPQIRHKIPCNLRRNPVDRDAPRNRSNFLTHTILNLLFASGIRSFCKGATQYVSDEFGSGLIMDNLFRGTGKENVPIDMVGRYVV